MRNPFKKNPAPAPALSEEQQKTLTGFEERFAQVEKSGTSAEKLAQLEEIQADLNGPLNREDDRIFRKRSSRETIFDVGNVSLTLGAVIAGIALHATPLGLVGLPIMIGAKLAGNRGGKKISIKLHREAAPFHKALESLGGRAIGDSDALLKADPALLTQSTAYKRMIGNAPNLVPFFAALAARPAIPEPSETAPPRPSRGKLSL